MNVYLFLKHSFGGQQIHRVILILTATALLVTSSLAAQDPTSAGRPVANNPELERIYQEDQAERATKGKKPGPDAAERDRERLKQVAALLDAGAARTADDFFHAAQVYNHGVTAEEILRAHVLAMLAAAKGNTQALFLSAASLDRFLRTIGRPQVFGTQYNRQGNMATMEPFDRSMSDALRTAFGVPSLKEQEARLKDMNKRQDQ
ncbi:MAG: hypothetical protein ACREBD_18490 [Blastocatellia bacterium]